ncbi:MAG TPA: glycoside hydrolase [Ruminococcaceae bacterium]|nr:glycoside hydrolase [Oscillospiraceae bacterium]
MKKLTAILTTASVLAVAILAGCSSDPTASNPPKKPATKDEPATETTVSTTGNKIQVNDATLGQIWIPELDGVAVNKLDKNGFTSDNSFKYYSEGGKPASLEGIDISSYSGDIEWQKVKDSGIDFVMVRLGGRGYGNEGATYRDERALEYIKGAQAVGIKAGGYFFSQAVTTNEAIEEADMVKEILGDTKLDFPVAYDWEIIKDDDARTDAVTPAQATENAKAFCQTVASHGYTPIIYSTGRELYFKYDLSKLAEYDVWYCEYSDVPDFYYEFSMWQYSKSGQVDGIEGNVDLDMCFTNVADYAK